MSQNFIVSLIVLIFSSISQGWNYKEQDKWPAACQEAIAQSPIDITWDHLKKIEEGPIVLKNWDQDYNATMINNGHTVLVQVSNKEPIAVTGGGLPGVYKLIQFHFHWGAEHTLDGDRKALELHFVNINTQYETINDAVKYRNGIAVLTVLYEKATKNNTLLKPITDNIKFIRKTNQNTSIQINPRKLLPRDLTRFWRYFGSLTTPNCNDVVVWTIFSRIIPISKAQVQEFSTIRDKEGKLLSQNYREKQPLNERTVFSVYTNDS